MYIYRVIPLTKLPRPHLQIPSYYSGDKFDIGQLVEVPIRSRKVPAIVVQVDRAEDQKQFIKKVSFSLKKIDKELTSGPVLSRNFIKTGIVLADHYFASLGHMIQRMLPPFFSKPSKPLLKLLRELPEPPQGSNKDPKKTLLISGDRKEHYKKYIDNGGVMMLVPQYLQLDKMKADFEEEPLVMRSGMPQVKWRNAWKDAYTGEAANIVGTRAALFTPFKELKTIIVDNENNTSHVSWDMHPKFDARYAAEVMSSLFGTDLIEGDALPSMEKYHKAKEEEWEIIKDTPELAPCNIVDMREELKSNNSSIFSQQVRKLLEKAGEKDKILMLITRKGLSSALICRDCGHVVNCPDCDAPAILHERSGSFRLICHQCGKNMRPPNVCPACHSHKIKQLGGGTQRVAKEVFELAPHLAVVHMDSDVAKEPEKQKEIFAKFRDGETNILVATQMALKEYLLPELDHSIAVMLDSALYLPEYRSQERVFEAIWRLRHITKTGVTVQTYHPETPVFSYSQGESFESFYEDELKKRSIFSWPPYSQIIKLTLRDRDPQKTEREAAALKQKLEVQIRNLKRNSGLDDAGIQLLGPAPAFIPKVAGKYVWYMLIKWPKGKDGTVRDLALRNKLLEVAAHNWEVEVDPVDIV